MKITIKITVFILVFILAGALAYHWLPREMNQNDMAALKIGAGDDITGILMRETVRELGSTYELSDTVESSSFQDCCSNTAQWALNAEEINIAFYCSHIAKHTVDQNPDVMIYGPVVMNAEMICYKENWEAVERVGVTQGREQQKSIAKRTYPQISEYVEITQKGLLYAMEDGQVDALILDLTKAAQAPDYQYQPLEEQDYISYVLVADREFVKSEAFSDFIKCYNKAVARLEQNPYLAEALGVTESWLADRTIKFLMLEEQ